jgi:hypothetical protein
MAEQFQERRAAAAETAWLSNLVETMDAVSRPEAEPCRLSLQQAVQAHLAGPSIPAAFYGSKFSLNN